MTLRANISNKARAHFVKALDLCRQMQDLHGEAYVLRDLAQMERSLGRSDEANTGLETALALLKQIGDIRGQAQMLWRLAVLQSDRQAKAAKQHYLAAAELYARLGNEKMERRARERAHKL
jgi:hypothetical protein